jgi:hypothetical protein
MSFESPGDDKRCDHCDVLGVPYEYQGRTFSGLSPNLGDRLCSRCLFAAVDAENAARPDPGVTPYWKGGRMVASTQTRKALGVPKGVSMESFRASRGAR